MVNENIFAVIKFLFLRLFSLPDDFCVIVTKGNSLAFVSWHVVRRAWERGQIASWKRVNYTMMSRYTDPESMINFNRILTILTRSTSARRPIPLWPLGFRSGNSNWEPRILLPHFWNKNQNFCHYKINGIKFFTQKCSHAIFKSFYLVHFGDLFLQKLRKWD